MKTRRKLDGITRETIIEGTGVQIKVLTNGIEVARYQHYRKGNMAHWSEWKPINEQLMCINKSRGAVKYHSFRAGYLACIEDFQIEIRDAL